MKKMPFREKDLSVRTTFTLNEDTIRAIKTIALENEIEMKELFESITNLMSKLPNKKFSDIPQKDNTVRCLKKTYVLTKDSLEYLKYYSKKYKVPRDQLIEFMVKIYPTEIALEEEMLRQSHVKALTIIKNFISGGENTIIDLYKFLDEDDPIPDIFELILDLSRALENIVESEIEKGTPIDIPVNIAIAINDLSKEYD